MTHLLRVDGLTKHFRTPAGTVHALDGVTLEVAAGETLGLVGESGCGKSTLGKTLVRLYEPDAGHVELLGVDISHLGPARLRPLRREMQMIFQDPFASLNPRSTVARILEEPMLVHRTGTRAERKARVAALLQRVGLRPEHGARLPHEFSGGQRQRVGIARALAVEPSVIIADEPVSALDVSVQAQIVNLFLELQERLGLALLFITHDLRLVRHIAHRTAVMYLGRIVETGPTEAMFTAPRHPYTAALMSAVPQVDPGARRRGPAVQGELPSAIAPPPGCPFHPRCPIAVARCTIDPPALISRGLPDWPVACHLAGAYGTGTDA